MAHFVMRCRRDAAVASSCFICSSRLSNINVLLTTATLLLIAEEHNGAAVTSERWMWPGGCLAAVTGGAGPHRPIRLVTEDHAEEACRTCLEKRSGGERPVLAHETDGVRFPLCFQCPFRSKPIFFGKTIGATSRFPHGTGKSGDLIFGGVRRRANGR
jgi:hypothetical protein